MSSSTSRTSYAPGSHALPHMGMTQPISKPLCSPTKMLYPPPPPDDGDDMVDFDDMHDILCDPSHLYVNHL